MSSETWRERISHGYTQTTRSATSIRQNRLLCCFRGCRLVVEPLIMRVRGAFPVGLFFDQEKEPQKTPYEEHIQTFAQRQGHGRRGRVYRRLADAPAYPSDYQSPSSNPRKQQKPRISSVQQSGCGSFWCVRLSPDISFCSPGAPACAVPVQTVSRLVPFRFEAGHGFSCSVKQTGI